MSVVRTDGLRRRHIVSVSCVDIAISPSSPFSSSASRSALARPLLACETFSPTFINVTHMNIFFVQARDRDEVPS